MAENFDLAAVRRRKIAELVRVRGAMGIRDLGLQFGVSDATVRRDLKALDDEGIVVRTHGGVLMNANVRVDLPNEERKAVGTAEKRRIGEAAVEMLVWRRGGVSGCRHDRTCGSRPCP